MMMLFIELALIISLISFIQMLKVSHIFIYNKMNWTSFDFIVITFPQMELACWLNFPPALQNGYSEFKAQRHHQGTKALIFSSVHNHTHTCKPT